MRTHREGSCNPNGPRRPLSPFARLGTEKLLYIAPGFHFRPPVHFSLGMAAAIVRAALEPFRTASGPYFHPGPARWHCRYIRCCLLLLRIHHPTSLPSSLLTLPIRTLRSSLITYALNTASPAPAAAAAPPPSCGCLFSPCRIRARCLAQMWSLAFSTR